MGIEDTIINAITQIFSQSFFISALLMGYSVIFLYYFGLDEWNKIAFGERLVLGFIVGVPFASLILLASNVFNIFGSLLGTTYPWDFGFYLMSGLVIVYFVGLRLSNKLPQIVKSGEHGNPLEGKHAFFAYLPPAFVGSLMLVLKVSEPTLSTFSWNQLGSLLLLSLMLLGAYVIVLAVGLALLAPSSPTELLSMELEYMFYSREVKHAAGRIRAFLRIPHSQIEEGELGKTSKVIILVLVIGSGVYLPIANSTLVIFTPRLEATTYSWYPSTNVIYVTSSAQNRSVPFAMISVVATYNFTTPWLPFFEIQLRNPSNYSGNPWSYYNSFLGPSVSRVTTGQIRVIQVNGTNNQISGFAVQPLWQGNKIGASLVLRYTNVLNLPIQDLPRIQKTLMQTFANGTEKTTYSFSMTNTHVFPLDFSQYYLISIPGTKVAFSGTYCQPGCSGLGLYFQNDTRNLIATFNVGALRTVNGIFVVSVNP